LSFRCDTLLSKMAFMEGVLPLLTSNTLRAKGILWFQEMPRRRFIFQFAAQRYSFEDVPMKSHDGVDSTTSEFVIIGRDLDQQAIELAFRACS